ncbi:MAG: VWA domain-containing protein, partial [Planctomycetes bacterium]|nr:VWA domain-containing protein [Planctomycetota bacterium]
MRVAFEDPLLLLAIPALWALLAVFRGPARRGRVALGVRALVVAVLVAALARPYRPESTEEARGTVLLLDRSGSISPAGLAEEDALLAGESDVRRIGFGDGRTSDARAALFTAAAGPEGRVLLVTDGWLEPGAAGLVADLGAAGRSVGILPVESERAEVPRVPLASPVLALAAPPRSGEPAEVRVIAPGASRISLSLDGKELVTAEVTSGEAVFPGLRLPAGGHTLLAIAESPGGRSAAALDVAVEGPLAVAVAGGGPDHPVAVALARQGFDVRAEPAGIPPLDTVRVLVAVSAAALPADAGDLPAFLRAGGGLLAVTGPPPALADLSGTRVEALLPAEAAPRPPEPTPPPPEPPPPPDRPEEGARPAEVPKDAHTLTVVLVVDRSGSMRGGKIAMARAAALAAARALDPVDRIGLLAFSDTFEWIRRIAPAGDLGGLERALRNLDATGGTEAFPAVREVFSVLRADPASVRHVILISDGQDLLSGFNQMLTGMVAEKITLSTVGVGLDYDPRFLGSLAQWGQGRFYDATDPRDLPRVVTLDTRRVVDTAGKPPPGEPSEDLTAGAKEPPPEPPPEEPEPPRPPPKEPVPVRPVSPLPVLAGLEFPPLPEVEPCRPRFPALTALDAGGDPALLLWRVGAGRVALIPADLAAWAAWEDLPRFLGQLTRLLAGDPPGPEAPPPAVAIRAGRLIVEGTGEPPAGHAAVEGDRRPLSFVRTGPDRFEAPLPAASPGSVIVASVEA